MSSNRTWWEGSNKEQSGQLEDYRERLNELVEGLTDLLQNPTDEKTSEDVRSETNERSEVLTLLVREYLDYCKTLV